jgi:hypothetical protein
MRVGKFADVIPAPCKLRATDIRYKGKYFDEKASESEKKTRYIVRK